MHNKGFMAVHKEAVCALALSWSLHNWHVLEWEGIFWGVAPGRIRKDWALQGSDQQPPQNSAQVYQNLG